MGELAVSMRNLAIVFVAVEALLLSGFAGDLAKAHPAEGLLTFEYLADVLKDLASALVVALVIIVTIEAQSRKADEANADRLRHAVATDVFRGVFSRRLTREYIDRVIDLDLRPKLVRTQLRMRRSLLAIKAATPDLEPVCGDLLLMKTEFQYVLANATETSIVEPFRLGLPRREGALGELSRLVRMEIHRDGDRVEALQPSPTDSPGQRSYHVDIALRRDETINVIVEMDAVKERSDSDAWRTNYPTLSGDICIESTLPDLKLGAGGPPGALLFDKLEGDGCTVHWTLQSALLPHHAIIFWWAPKDT